MNGTWQIFISDTEPNSLGNGVRFYYNPTSNKLRYRDPEGGLWVDVPEINLFPYLTKVEASNTYLTTPTASAVYLNKVDAQTIYLTKTDASYYYLTPLEASEIYLTEANAENVYLTQPDAAIVYATLQSPTFSGNVYLPTTTTIGNVSSTEIGYLSGATESIQGQINTKTQYTVIETTGDVEAFKDFQILANTTEASLTVTLPENPLIGDSVYVVDVARTSFKKPIFVEGNDNLVHGKSEIFAINSAGATVVFMYVSGIMGWKVI